MTVPTDVLFRQENQTHSLRELCQEYKRVVAPHIFMVSNLSVYRLISTLTVRRVFYAQITVGYFDFAVISC